MSVDELAGQTAYYMQGACYELALALHDETGMPLAILYDDAQTWDYDDDPDNSIAQPCHVFVFDPADDDMIVDARGRRPHRQMVDELCELGVMEPRTDWQVSRDELVALTGDNEPFFEVRDQDLADALAFARKAGLL